MSAQGLQVCTVHKALCPPKGEDIESVQVVVRFVRTLCGLCAGFLCRGAT